MQVAVQVGLVHQVLQQEQHQMVVAQELTQFLLLLLEQQILVAVLVAVALALTMLAQQVAQVSL
jgi:hypothetical protein